MPDYVIGGYASQAAILNGRVYTGDTDGSVFEIDMRRRTSRLIPPPTQRERDHSQLVAFMGEIWVMGGRTPETNTTAIYDPVTERWRVGPPMSRAHAGYGAYLRDMERIFREVARIMKRGSFVVVHADNIAGRTFTPLVRDLSVAIGRVLRLEMETVVAWEGAPAGRRHTHCLVFRKEANSE